jgi:hypothetical protein
MALLGMKETAAAARWANVGALGILRLHEEFVRFPPTSEGGSCSPLVIRIVLARRARDAPPHILACLWW